MFCEHVAVPSGEREAKSRRAEQSSGRKEVEGSYAHAHTDTQKAAFGCL